jgi:hypothetical protein
MERVNAPLMGLSILNPYLRELFIFSVFQMFFLEDHTKIVLEKNPDQMANNCINGIGNHQIKFRVNGEDQTGKTGSYKPCTSEF